MNQTGLWTPVAAIKMNPIHLFDKPFLVGEELHKVLITSHLSASHRSPNLNQVVQTDL